MDSGEFDVVGVMLARKLERIPEERASEIKATYNFDGISRDPDYNMSVLRAIRCVERELNPPLQKKK